MIIQHTTILQELIAEAPLPAYFAARTLDACLAMCATKLSMWLEKPNEGLVEELSKSQSELIRFWDSGYANAFYVASRKARRTECILGFKSDRRSVPFIQCVELKFKFFGMHGQRPFYCVVFYFSSLGSVQWIQIVNCRGKTSKISPLQGVALP